MAQRSSIEELPEPIRDAVLAAIADGRTCDQIVDVVRGLGGEASRSAVGRYKKSFAEIADRQRSLQTVARALAKDFGEEGDQQNRLLLQLVTSLATDAVMRVHEGDEAPPDAQTLHFYARAAKDITSAAKTNTDREVRIRDEAAKKAKADAAVVAETGLRASGASAETIRKVRADILGLAA